MSGYFPFSEVPFGIVFRQNLLSLLVFHFFFLFITCKILHLVRHEDKNTLFKSGNARWYSLLNLTNKSGFVYLTHQKLFRSFFCTSFIKVWYLDHLFLFPNEGRLTVLLNIFNIVTFVHKLPKFKFHRRKCFKNIESNGCTCNIYLNSTIPNLLQTV